MLKAEQTPGEPIEKALPRLIDQHGVSQTARHLGVSVATVNYWMLKLGVHVRWVAITSQDCIIIKCTG